MSMRKIWVDMLRANKIPPSPDEEKDINWLDSFRYGHEFISSLEQVRRCKTTTLAGYADDIHRFCDFVGMNPDQLIEWALEGINLAYQDPTKNFERERVKRLLRDKAPTMKRMKKVKGYRYKWVETDDPISGWSLFRIQVVVASFMSKNSLGFEFDFADPLPPNTKIPKFTDVLAMEQNVTNLRDAAILALFSSCGMRPATLLELKWSDIQDTKVMEPYDSRVPLCIIIPPSLMKGRGIANYKNCWQIGFLHEQAAKLLEAYKTTINPKPDDLLFKKNERDTSQFINYDILIGMIETLRVKTFGTAPDKQFNYTSFRHFVQECYANAGIADIDICGLVGHVIHSMTGKYVRTNMNITSDSVRHLRDEFIRAIEKGHLCS